MLSIIKKHNLKKYIAMQRLYKEAECLKKKSRVYFILKCCLEIELDDPGYFSVTRGYNQKDSPLLPLSQS